VDNCRQIECGGLGSGWPRPRSAGADKEEERHARTCHRSELDPDKVEEGIKRIKEIVIP
jgi:hypothetical protein